jgi:DNA-binding NarL/FixJ family response regulator
MRIKVLLVDDQVMVRKGFRLLLEAEEDIHIIGEAENGADAISQINRTNPDVVLMDVQMPVMDGLEATRQIVDRKPEISPRVLILTTFEKDEYIFEALRSGASGFLLKNAPPEDLIDAIRIVANGNALLAPSVTRRIISEFAKIPSTEKHKGKLEQLTVREVEILQLLAKGSTNAEIANTLFISEATVKTHISNTFTKLDLRDRVQAVVFAYESGLVQPGMSQL